VNQWRELWDELDAWRDAGQSATLWWRDDDAVEPTPALDRLLALAARTAVPVALAVVPAGAGVALADRLAEARGLATPLQHGYAHANHAADGEKKAELGASRPLERVREELARGAARMAALFGTRALRVLVPPWNRVADEVVACLPALGFTGLSTYLARAAAVPVPGLTAVNTHADILRWTAPRGFLGESETLALLSAHLGARRRGPADAAEPTGVLSHHLAHDEAAWRFLETLLPRLSEHPAVRWLSALEAFGPRAGPKTGGRP
jgi:hypothetical protein